MSDLTIREELSMHYGFVAEATDVEALKVGDELVTEEVLDRVDAYAVMHVVDHIDRYSDHIDIFTVARPVYSGGTQTGYKRGHRLLRLVKSGETKLRAV